MRHQRQRGRRGLVSASANQHSRRRAAMNAPNRRRTISNRLINDNFASSMTIVVSPRNRDPHGSQRSIDDQINGGIRSEGKLPRSGFVQRLALLLRGLINTPREARPQRKAASAANAC
jgi:hypothetical protein